MINQRQLQKILRKWGYSPLIHQTTAVITDAQIKALSSTPVTIISGAGAGKVILPVGGVIRLDPWFADYVIPDESTLSFGRFTWDQLTDQSLPGIFALGGPSIGLFGSSEWNVPYDPPSYFSDLPMQLIGNTIFTGGHVDNILLFSVAYMIFNLSTGTFE